MVMHTETALERVPRWEIFEIALNGQRTGNPYADVSLVALFRYGEHVFEIEGFYDGDGCYRIRFMPGLEGAWSYSSRSSAPELDGISGGFICGPPKKDAHGVVRVARTFHFVYEDGRPYFPVGTTCYAWTHQGSFLEEQTLETLSRSPFNKIRMCIFPKHYDYNSNEPEFFPFEGTPQRGWDFTRFRPDFFRHLEKRIGELRALGIEADLILFHPYDRWGFSDMGAEADDRYVRYVVARLSAYRNVWWSLANEYDLPTSYGSRRRKTPEDWERFAAILVKWDPHGHLRSIHNCRELYDHGKPWITHCSIQRIDVYKTSEMTSQWREDYHKPVVIDECAYEGNIDLGWGNITASEMVRRTWEGVVRGGYVGHGETYLDPAEVLWWSKGGVLHGQSPERIGFMKRILEEGPVDGLSPISFGMESWDLPCGGVPGKYYLFYFGFNQPAFRKFHMPEGQKFTVDIIDTWNMELHRLPGTFTGQFRIELPGRQFMAVRILRESEA